MPYVEVWVDEPACKCECDGKCDRGLDADVLDAKLDEAVRALQIGDNALALRILVGDEPVTRRSDLRLLYAKWKSEGLAGFLPYQGAKA